MISIKFLDFDASAELKNFARQKLASVFELAPSDAFSYAKLVKTFEGFEGELKVNSLAGRFVARVKSSDPVMAVEEMAKRLNQELRSWKMGRFFNEPRLFEGSFVENDDQSPKPTLQ